MEIGFGTIAEEASKIIPRYGQCTDGCGRGIANSTKVDALVVSAVSNWGAYGVSACMAALLRKPEVLHDKQTELRMLQECVDAGGIDGVKGMPTFSVDDLPGESHAIIVELLRMIVERGTVPFKIVPKGREKARALC